MFILKSVLRCVGLGAMLIHGTWDNLFVVHSYKQIGMMYQPIIAMTTDRSTLFLKKDGYAFKYFSFSHANVCTSMYY